MGEATFKAILGFRRLENSDFVDLDGTPLHYTDFGLDITHDQDSVELQWLGRTAGNEWTEFEYVIGLYYYARIVRAMFLDVPAEDDPTMTFDLHNSVLVGALVVFTVVFGVYWAPLSSLAARSLLFIGG